MNRFKKSKYIIVLFVVILVVSVFLVTTQSSTVVTKAGDGVSLIDRIVQKPFQWLESTKSDLGNLTRAYNENETLKKEFYQMEKEKNEADRLKEENEQLRQLLDMKSKLNATKLIAADVIMRTPSTWKQELTVNVGTQQGVTTSMLVVSGGGLVGSVENVEDNSTVVNLLTNAENTEKISVKIQHGSSSIYGIIVGYDKEKELLKISQLNNSGDISQGDKVVTGGLGNFNATDISVGEVVSVTHSTDYLTREVMVKLHADPTNLKVVELVGNVS